MNPTDSVEYAGFWRRSGALAVDSILFALLSAFSLYALYGPDYYLWAKENTELFAFYGWEELLVDNVLPPIITVFLWVKLLGTPGKLLLGCQVVDQSTFQPLSVKQAIIRYLSYFVSLLPLGLGFFWVAWDKRKQGFHDKIAKTVVIIEDEAHLSLAELELEAKK